MTDTNDENEPSEPPDPQKASKEQDDDSTLARKKLTLEIKELEKKIKWWAQPIFATGVGVFFGVLGLFLTSIQFQRQQAAEQTRTITEQSLERTSRFQNQIRGDIEELQRFPRDQQLTVSRISFLLEDIKSLLESQVSENQKMKDAFKHYERGLTESLVFLVQDDCDFTKNPRDVEFANMLVGRWEDYSTYLKGDPGKFDYVMQKYITAVEDLREQNPGYFEHISLNKQKDAYVFDPEYQKLENESILYGHFLDILDGFKMHLDIFGSDTLSEEETKRKESTLRKFQAALCNQEVSTAFLGIYFPDEPCTGGG